MADDLAGDRISDLAKDKKLDSDCRYVVILEGAFFDGAVDASLADLSFTFSRSRVVFCLYFFLFYCFFRQTITP